jgi:hypothetical protein
MGRRRRRGGPAPVVALADDVALGPEHDERSRADIVAAIVLALALNALPLWGVLAGEWSIAALMVLFWIENVFAGLVTAARMAMLPGPTVLQGMKFAAIPFFAVHYGGFALVHGLFVFAQFVPDGVSVWREPGFGWAVLVAAGVQAWQAWQEHRIHVPEPVTEAERQAGHKDPKVAREQTIPLMRLMAEPYLRVGILHVVIVIGAMVSVLLGTPLASLLLLIALKAAYEIAQATGAVKRLLARAH